MRDVCFGDKLEFKFFFSYMFIGIFLLFFLVVIYFFDDYNVFLYELIEFFCEDVDEFLFEDEKNVVFIYCKVGKVKILYVYNYNVVYYCIGYVELGFFLF